VPQSSGKPPDMRPAARPAIEIAGAMPANGPLAGGGVDGKEYAGAHEARRGYAGAKPGRSAGRVTCAVSRQAEAVTMPRPEEGAEALPAGERPASFFIPSNRCGEPSWQTARVIVCSFHRAVTRGPCAAALCVSISIATASIRQGAT
jgi:hypothetical protein